MFATRYAGLLLLLVLSTIPALTPARASINTAMPTSAETFSEQERAAIFREIKVFANAKTSVRDAIEIAETRSNGARAVDVSFDGQADRMAYRVKTWRNDEVWQGTIDASTGKIFGEEVVTPFSTLDAKDKDELAGFRTAGINLYDVLSIAERFGHSRAVSAGLEEQNGRPIFLVVLVAADGSLKQMSVTPGSEGNAHDIRINYYGLGRRAWLSSVAHRHAAPRLARCAEVATDGGFCKVFAAQSASVGV